jgi:hypothetical protein
LAGFAHCRHFGLRRFTLCDADFDVATKNGLATPRQFIGYASGQATNGCEGRHAQEKANRK